MKLTSTYAPALRNSDLARLMLPLFRYLLLTICGWVILYQLGSAGPAQAQDPPPARRVNAPFFSGNVLNDQGAIFWFGQVDNTSNYADVRLGYNNDHLSVTIHIIDRRLWYDPTHATADLTTWDAVSLYLNLEGNAGNIPTPATYHLVAQVNWWEARTDYQAAYRGNGSGWTATSAPFTTTSGWRGNAFNDSQDDKGWLVNIQIPFSSLGLTGPPPPGMSWGLALVVHDRDDAARTAIPNQSWPETIDPQQPSTWGQLIFGLPGHNPPLAASGEIVTIRHGVNGNTVSDAHVGGHTTCGGGLDHWTEWGEANYASYAQVNIQNQWDVSDYPCFSKYYVTFPLDSLPPGKVIISATLTLYLFGNAGYSPGDAQPSLIQALNLVEAWEETSLTWNNAPLPVENMAATWVYPVDFFDPGVPYHWKVSRSVAAAYTAGEPLRLVLYSADGEYHSGKYFWSSDADGPVRPTLEVLWGEPVEARAWVYLPLVLKR